MLVHRIYETEVGTDYPVVEHRFFGSTQQQAIDVYNAHRRTDEFLRGCDDRRKWGGIECVTTVHFERI